MGLSTVFWKTYHIIRDPDKLYQEGFSDAMHDVPRRQFKMSILFGEIKNLQANYDKGYDDGLHEKLVRRL